MIKYNDEETKQNSEKENRTSKIVEIRYGTEIYKTWTTKLIQPLLIKYLREKYQDSLIVREINKVDFVLFDKKSNDVIPIELQKVVLHNGTQKFMTSAFESEIRGQLEDNISTYGICWFFFDAEYLRYLQYGNVRKSTNIDLSWLVQLMKANTLKVFTIRYDGVVKELTTKDFDFLKKLSQTCMIGYDNDERILNRNKLIILRNTLYGYNFTQDEISQFGDMFDNRNDETIKSSHVYFINSDNTRCKLYGTILHALGTIHIINDVLSCTAKDKPKYTVYGIIFGLFYKNDFQGTNRNARIMFVDRFNIAQYFPGYLRNKEMWEHHKEEIIFTMNEFRRITEEGRVALNCN